MSNRVDYFHNRADFDVVVLASLGFSTNYIRQFTKLSRGQVEYRIRKVGAKRADYREGRSHLALAMLKRNETLIQQTVRSQIRKELRIRHVEVA